MGDADIGPSGAGSGEQGRRSYALQRGCLVAAALLAFAVVVVPLLVWAAAIIFAGSR
jgi:Flp pilus assembly protein TadB